MCRMALLKGEFSEDFAGIFKSLQKASLKDPLPDPESDYRFLTHGDGWGYVNIGKAGISHVRNTSPIYVSEVPAVQQGTMMLHSRKTSDDQPGGMLSNHPFSVSVRGYQLFLSHNGWFDKYSMNTGESREDLEATTDSEAFLQYLAGKTSDVGSELEHVFANLDTDGVEYALSNIFLIIMKRSGEREGARSYYFTDKGSRGGNYEEFDKLYRIECKSWKGVVSSSLLNFDEFPEFDAREEIKRGTLFEL